MTKTLTTCKRHPSLLLEEPINLDTSKVRHCPCCGRPSKNRDYDEYDLLSIKYNAPRELIHTIDSERKRVFPKSESLQEFIVMTLQATPVKITNGYAPITISCSQCKSVFRFHRTTATPKVEPQFCMFCGSDQIHIHSQDNELDSWEILSQSYNLPVPALQTIYSLFAAQREYTHFNDFMKMLARQLREEKEVS